MHLNRLLEFVFNAMVSVMIMHGFKVCYDHRQLTQAHTAITL